MGQLWLGAMYLGGNGVNENYVMAYMWVSLAEDGAGKNELRRVVSMAGILKKLLISYMTPSMILEAQLLAGEKQGEIEERNKAD